MVATLTQPDELCRAGSVTIEAAEGLIGVKRTTIYKLIDEGKLVATKIGHRRLVLRESITRLLAANIVSPASN